MRLDSNGIVMNQAIDHYHKWLGIPLGERPPNHYQLLGIQPFEFDLDVIHNAADARMAFVKSLATGPYAVQSQELLNELSQARLCLSDPQQKADYDQLLREILYSSELFPQKPFESDNEAVVTINPTPIARRQSLSSRLFPLLLTLLLFGSCVTAYLVP